MDITSGIKTDFLQFQAEDLLSEVIGKLKQTRKRNGLVFKRGKYLGILETKGLLRARLDASKTKVGQFVQRTPLLDEHADVVEAAYMMFQSDLDMIPIVRRKEIVGVLDAVSLATLAVNMPEVKKVDVADLRLVKGVKLKKDAPLAKALELMYQKRVDHVPLLDNSSLYGILSYRDVLYKYFLFPPRRGTSTKYEKVGGTKGAQVDSDSQPNMPVHSFATVTNLLTVQKKTSLSEALQLLRQRNLMDVIVQEGNSLVGLLTVKNILRWLGSQKFIRQENIRFVGLAELKWHPYEVNALKKIAANEAFKLQRVLHNDVSLVIHVKEYGKGGKRQKYSIHLRIEYPGRTVEVAQEDWDWRIAVRKTFANAANKVNKLFRA